MFCLNIALGNTAWRLLYKDAEKAEAAYVSVYTPDSFSGPLLLQDDFGQCMSATRASIHGAMLEDMDQTKMAHVEMMLHQTRMQVLAQKMAQSDPALKASMMMASPAVHSPFNGRMA